MASRSRISSVALISLITTITGCGFQDVSITTAEDTNKKTAVSCVAGAPVCKDVEIDKLDPELANDVRKRLKEQEESERTAQAQQQNPAPASGNATDENTLVAKASTAIIGACTGWQLGTIQRSQIMDTAKQLFAKQGYDPNSVDWSRAITVAKELDRQNNLGCIN